VIAVPSLDALLLDGQYRQTLACMRVYGPRVGHRCAADAGELKHTVSADVLLKVRPALIK
jgi:hypothetical protein